MLLVQVCTQRRYVLNITCFALHSPWKICPAACTSTCSCLGIQTTAIAIIIITTASLTTTIIASTTTSITVRLRL